jgi:uncharacterized protein YbgA (DUF1722 family)
VGTRDAGLDLTDALASYGRRMAEELTDISGYILKRASPSCGLERVKVYRDGDRPRSTGTGIYARELMEGQPLLPVEEEGRLNDPLLRESFIARVYAHHRWHKLQRTGLTAGGLVDFHTRHKLLLMAHSPQAYRELGRLVANAGNEPLQPLAARYIEQFMAALKERAPRKRHVNVLHHLLGYLKKRLDADDRRELVNTIDAYRRGELPLVVPVSLLAHHFRRHPMAYIQCQVYMQPYPADPTLRNVL